MENPSPRGSGDVFYFYDTGNRNLFAIYNNNIDNIYLCSAQHIVTNCCRKKRSLKDRTHGQTKLQSNLKA